MRLINEPLTCSIIHHIKETTFTHSLINSNSYSIPIPYSNPYSIYHSFFAFIVQICHGHFGPHSHLHLFILKIIIKQRKL